MAGETVARVSRREAQELKRVLIALSPARTVLENASAPASVTAATAGNARDRTVGSSRKMRNWEGKNESQLKKAARGRAGNTRLVGAVHLQPSGHTFPLARDTTCKCVGM